MLRVALTGNVASGKSAVASVWASAGVPVVSADDLSRRAVEPGSAALHAVRDTFGEEFLADDGSLDRARMRELVFRDPEARKVLEKLLHPRIEALRREWTAAREREGADLVVFEIPLLFELGREDEFDVVVVVDAPEPSRQRRLVEGRGLDAVEARRIMNSQGSAERKRAAADLVIENTSDLAALEDAALETLRRIREELAGNGSIAHGSGASRESGTGSPERS